MCVTETPAAKAANDLIIPRSKGWFFHSYLSAHVCCLYSWVLELSLCLKTQAPCHSLLLGCSFPTPFGVLLCGVPQRLAVAYAFQESCKSLQGFTLIYTWMIFSLLLFVPTLFQRSSRAPLHRWPSCTHGSAQGAQATCPLLTPPPPSQLSMSPPPAAYLPSLATLGPPSFFSCRRSRCKSHFPLSTMEFHSKVACFLDREEEISVILEVKAPSPELAVRRSQEMNRCDHG